MILGYMYEYIIYQHTIQHPLDDFMASSSLHVEVDDPDVSDVNEATLNFEA
jgi:hypothetical protein